MIPLESYVKLSYAKAAILVAGRGNQTQFWQGITQGPFHQSLVQIGWTVSEKKIFLNLNPPFSIFSLTANLDGGSGYRTHFWKGVTKGPFHKSLVLIG